MAKMFYTVEEAAKRLKMSVDEVRKLAENGQLSEFRDRDKLVFRKEQVDLLAGGQEASDAIPLADSGAPLGIDDSRGGSGSGSAMEGSTKERSGISIFEADESDNSDPSAQTQVTSSVGGMPSPAGDPGASGSGLLGLTRDADDSHLGSDLLKDVYGEAGPPGSDSTDQGPLFENAGVASDVAAAGAMAGAGGGMAMAYAEPYDGAGSGLAGGLALGMIVVLLLVMVVTLFGIVGVTGSGLVAMLGGNFWPAVGGAAVLVLALGGIGWFLGNRQ